MSKEKKMEGRSSEMLTMKNQTLHSVNRNTTAAELPNVGNNLISKDLEDVQKILKANDEYLKQNEYLSQPQMHPTLKKP